MKMTKVIREYMEETLSAKRLEVNKEARADYDARCKACIDELKALRESMREPIENILRKYGMDMEYKWCSNVRPMFDEVWDMNESRIQNQNELAVIRNKETERAVNQQKAMHDIELEMALGGDKAKFMEMLSKVVIE